MSAIKIYYNDSLWIVMWDHRPPGRFAPHDKICDILRAVIKSRISADMLSLRIWYSVIIRITYSLLHKCNFFQMLMQINRSNWGHLQKGALCPMLLYLHSIILTSAAFARNDLCQIAAHRCHINYIHMECLDVQVINRQLTEDGACISPQLDCFNLSGPEKEEANETGEG